MPRGYRLFVAAAIGWLTLVGASPGDDGKAQNRQTNRESQATKELSRIAAALEKPSETPTPDSGCPDRNDDRQSDLCAQWKAADASQQSAEWAWWQTMIGTAGLLLGAVTMGAAIFAAIYAKRAAVATEKTVAIAAEASEGAGEALRIAERNADAAANLVLVSQEGSRQELRAYVVFEKEMYSFAENSTFGGVKGDWLRYRGCYRNCGRTPALDVSFADMKIVVDPSEEPSFFDEDFIGNGILGPNIIGFTQWTTLSQSEVDDAFYGRSIIYLLSKVNYKDIYGNHRKTQTCTRLTFTKPFSRFKDEEPGVSGVMHDSFNLMT